MYVAQKLLTFNPFRFFSLAATTTRMRVNVCDLGLSLSLGLSW